MYLRHTTVTKNGKTHTYWRLVRSVRNGTKVRQETVLQLGELDEQGRIRARALSQSFLGVERQPGWFDDPLPDQPLTIDLKGLRLERGRRLGDVWLARQLWRAVGLDRELERLLPRSREDISWATMATLLVLARLCDIDEGAATRPRDTGRGRVGRCSGRHRRRWRSGRGSGRGS
jgi:hypothetical protein